MKIGLLTFHDTNNFGSYLQTYGLYKKIIDLQEIETENLIINIDDARVAPAISFVGVY